VNRLQEQCRSSARPTVPSRRQRCTQPTPRRIVEQTLRSNVVDLCQWTQQGGLSLPQTAELLQLSPRTLRHWQQLLHNTVLMPPPLLGRPLAFSARCARQAVLDLLKPLGPDTSLAFLQDHFPTFARAELEDLLRRYRRVCQRRYPPNLHVLQWTTPGAVWAMDFTVAPTALDGKFPYLFAVRDLASGRLLLWQPVAGETAQVTRFHLALLFALHGAPLVLKSDNGSAFRDETVQALVASAGTLLLYSPPRTPRYNGAIEASIGASKRRTERQAAYLGRPGQWTAEDAAAAQAEANAAPRTGDRRGPSRQELWQARPRLTPEQRQLFQHTVEQLRAEERAREGLAQEGPWTAAEERQVDRQAIRRALVEHGYLLFSRRRIPLPIEKLKTANIT
jgi:transposase InsO family protein